MWGQRFAADATPEGPEFRVNAIEIGKQFIPTVAMLTGGGFAIAYHTSDEGNRNFEVMVRLFDDDGLGPDEIQVNTYADANQWLADVAPTPGGGVVLAWESYAQDGDEAGVFARYLDGGYTDDAELQVSTQSAYEQTEATVATGADGRYVIAWTQIWADGSTVVHLRVFPSPVIPAGD